MERATYGVTTIAPRPWLPIAIAAPVCVILRVEAQAAPFCFVTDAPIRAHIILLGAFDSPIHSSPVVQHDFASPTRNLDVTACVQLVGVRCQR
eukprot:14531-Eustigmatos_ZCMA.PRE.1